MGKTVEGELVRRAVAGEADAFASLIRAHYDGIFRMAWRWLGSREDAEDVAQNVCLRVGRAMRSFRGDASFSTWLYRFTYNASLDCLRARRRQNRHQDPGVIVLFGDGADQPPDHDAANADLWSEVRALPGQQRDAVLLVYAQEMNHAEAAGLMGCSEKTVSWHLHEARKRLKTRLQEAG